VDSLGRTQIFNITKEKSEKRMKTEEIFKTQVLEEPSKLYGCKGYSGLCINPNDGEKTIVSRFQYKGVSFFKNRFYDLQR
jgi:hypothetical protein